MRTFAAAVSLLAIVLATGPDRARAADTAAVPVRANLLSAWRDSLVSWKDLDREEISARNRRFYDTIRYEEVQNLCRTIDEKSPESRMLEGLLKQALDDLDFSATQLAGLLRDPGVGMPCHKGILMFLSHTKDRIDPARGDTLAWGLLDLVDRNVYEAGIRGQFEMAAAHLSRSDVLLDRIRDYSESQSEEIRASAFDMMAESTDPRTAALMKRVLEGYLAKRRIPPGRALLAAGRRLGPDGVDLLAGFLALSSDFLTVRRVPLEGLASTQDPRAFDYLLAEYGDSLTGIQDRTSEISDPVTKNRYFSLWHIGRVLEPALVTALEKGNPDTCRQAIEILDRGSRFGKCAQKDTLFPALHRAAGRPDLPPGERDRCSEIVSRFEVWAAQQP